MEKVKVGIVGTGYTIGIALPHVMAYQKNPDAELVALYDEVEGRACQWAKDKKIEDVHICQTYEELLSMVDAVSICTPNDTHVSLSIQALEEGVHVLCEKPISTDAKSAEEMLESAKKHPELVNMTGFCYRGIPAIQYMKSIIDQGKIGKVFACSHQLGGGRIAGRDNVKREWRMNRDRSGSGALADFGSHMLDLTDYLLSPTEGKITQVTALTSTGIKERYAELSEDKLPVTNDDCAVFTAKLEKGVVSTFLSSRIGMSCHRWEIIGDGGILIYEGEDEKVKVLLKEKGESFDFKKTPEVEEVPDEFKGRSRFEDEIDEFIDNILNKKQSSRDFQRGIYIQKILDKLDESAHEGISKSIEK